MSRFLSPTLAAVTPYTPGEQPQDQQYIKLNTNESPYLPSPAVIAAVSEHEVEKLRLYSDPACADLLKAAAAHFGLQPEQIMPGNGSDENLFFALRAFCDDPLAHAQVIAVAELGGHVACAVDFEHGEVGGFIEPDDDGVVKFTVIRFDLHGNGLGI